MIVSSMSEMTPNRASAAGTRTGDRGPERVGQAAVGRRELDAARSPTGRRASAGRELDAEVALAVGARLGDRVADADAQGYAGQLVGHELAQAAAQRRPDAPRPRPPRTAAGCRAPGRAPRRPAAPPCPPYDSIRKCSGGRPRPAAAAQPVRRPAPRPTSARCFRLTGPTYCRRPAVEWRRAARRRRRHLRGRRRDPVPQGQGRGDRRAARGAPAPDELETVTAYVGGSLRQRRTGLGWRGLTVAAARRPSPSTLTVLEVHEAFDRIAALAGTGSQAARATAVAELFGRATAEEQAWLRGVVTGEVRQGALDSLVQEALAAAARRAADRRTPGGDAGRLDGRRRAGGVRGGRGAGARSGSRSAGRCCRCWPPARPTWPRRSRRPAPAARSRSTSKLDGIRIQVHRSGADVVVATRSLEDITARLPEVVEVALALPAESFVLDGEALALDEAGRPRPFQETASRTAMGEGVAVTPYFFDVLHLDGADLLDSPAAERAGGAGAAGARRSTACRGWSPPSVAEARGLPRRDPRLRPRGRGGQGPRRAVRRRPPRLGLGQGQAGAHPRPGRARGRVGLGTPAGLALQHPPRRAATRRPAAS